MTATQFDPATDATFLEAFLASGDVGHLLPLADYADETDRPALAEDVRAVLALAPEQAEAVRFFVRHAGYSYGAEGPTAGRIRGALELARAEEWFAGLEDGHIEWEVDFDAMAAPSGDEEPRMYYGCVLTVDGTDQESLWNVDLAGDPWPRYNPARDPYARVVEAELAALLYARYPTGE